MGKIISSEFSQGSEFPEINLIAGLERENHPDRGKVIRNIPIFDEFKDLPESDVWVDFSVAAAVVDHARFASENSQPIVIAATGFSTSQLEMISEYSTKCAILIAPNLSVGIGAMDKLIRQAAEILGEDFDPTIIETHHKTKKDAPSGTAKYFLRHFDSVPTNISQVVSIRAGGAIGEHTIKFIGKHEELIITHRAWSRAAFSHGISRAVSFLIEQPPGIYYIEEIFT